jgi:hypothetical protein
MIKACIVPPDASRFEYKDIDPTLETFQGIVDGQIEGVYGPEGSFIYCNEEGKLLGLPINDAATRLSGIQGDVLCGTVVFVGQADEEGYDTDVPAEFAARVIKEVLA